MWQLGCRNSGVSSSSTKLAGCSTYNAKATCGSTSDDSAHSEESDTPIKFFFSSRRRHTRCLSDWSSDVCSSDLQLPFRRGPPRQGRLRARGARGTPPAHAEARRAGSRGAAQQPPQPERAPARPVQGRTHHVMSDRGTFPWRPALAACALLCLALLTVSIRAQAVQDGEVLMQREHVRLSLRR